MKSINIDRGPSISIESGDFISLLTSLKELCIDVPIVVKGNQLIVDSKDRNRSAFVHVEVPIENPDGVEYTVLVGVKDILSGVDQFGTGKFHISYDGGFITIADETLTFKYRKLHMVPADHNVFEPQLSPSCFLTIDSNSFKRIVTAVAKVTDEMVFSYDGEFLRIEGGDTEQIVFGNVAICDELKLPEDEVSSKYDPIYLKAILDICKYAKINIGLDDDYPLMLQTIDKDVRYVIAPRIHD